MAKTVDSRTIRIAFKLLERSTSSTTTSNTSHNIRKAQRD
jgi:hypothetical protein